MNWSFRCRWIPSDGIQWRWKLLLWIFSLHNWCLWSELDQSHDVERSFIHTFPGRFFSYPDHGLFFCLFPLFTVYFSTECFMHFLPPPPPKKTNVFNSNILRTSARCFGFILAYAHYKDSMCISRLCHRLEKIQLLKMGRFFGNLKLISRLNVKYPKKWFSVEKLLPNAHHGIVHFTQ